MSRRAARRSLRPLVCLAVLVVGVGDAQAAAPSAVEIVNAAQPGLVSSQPQPAVLLAARESCGSVYTPEEADGGPPPCAEGSWPAAAGDGWSPQIEVAGGDLLVLRFDAPATGVEIGSTTKFPPGLTDPDGRPVRNAWIVAPLAAAPTDDPARWTVRLPDPIDGRARSGATLAIVARSVDGARNFAGGIRTPRFDSYSGRCGTAYYGSGQIETVCHRPGGPKGVPPPAAPPPPPAAAKCHVELVRSTRRVERGGLQISARASGTTLLRATLRVRGRVIARREVSAANAGAFRLPVRSAARRRFAGKTVSTRLQIDAVGDGCPSVSSPLQLRFSPSRR